MYESGISYCKYHRYLTISYNVLDICCIIQAMCWIANVVIVTCMTKVMRSRLIILSSVFYERLFMGPLISMFEYSWQYLDGIKMCPEKHAIVWGNV